MTEQIQFYIMSGACGFGLLLVTAIWNEVRGMRNDIKSLSITQTRQENRLDNIEITLEKLPCTKFSCPK
jgi:hypothetical protein